MNKLIRVLKNPIWAVQRIKHKYFIIPKYQTMHFASHKKMLQKIEQDYDPDIYLKVVNEVTADATFIESINTSFQKYGVNKNYSRLDKYVWGLVIYYLIRKYKPEVIVETGVWHGNSTAFILLALNNNKKGQLYSIDLPAYYENGGYRDENPYKKESGRTSSLPKGAEPGFIVPEYLKKRWKLILGDSKTQLPKLLKEFNEVDFFLHDSLHSYENMIFEFGNALEKLKKEGFIFSDNIDWNNAFYDFANNNNLKFTTYLAYFETEMMKNNFGIIKK